MSLLLCTNPAIQFMVYDELKRAALGARRGRTAALSGLDVFVLGIVAKMAATLATYPLQIAQSRARTPRFAHLSTLACLAQIYREHGVAALFEVLRGLLLFFFCFCVCRETPNVLYLRNNQGMPAKMLQTCLAAAYTFLTYEQFLTVRGDRQ